MIEQPTEDEVHEKGNEWLVRSSMDLPTTISTHSDLQVLVKKLGAVSQVWSKEEADRMWNKGEVLLSFCNLCLRSTHFLLQGLLLVDVLHNEILRRRGKKEDQERYLMKTFQTANHHYDCQVPSNCSRARLLHDLQPGTGRHHRHPPTLQESFKFCLLVDANTQM